MTNLIRRAVVATRSGAPAGQSLFEANGSFVVPEGVTSISVATIGRGGPGGGNGTTSLRSGAGGALAWANDIVVTPGETLTVDVDDTHSRIRRGSTVLCGSGAGTSTTRGFVLTGTGFAGGSNSEDTSAPITSRRGGGAGTWTDVGAAGIGGSSASGAKSSPYGPDDTTQLLYGGGQGRTTAPANVGTILGCTYVVWGTMRTFPNNNVAPV